MIRIAALIFLIFGQEPDIEALLKQLSDDSVEVREKAIAALVDLDQKAEAKVRAHMASADLEVRLMCRKILDAIAVPRHLRGVLPPVSRVTIDAKDRPLRDVLRDLQLQTGMPMKLPKPGDALITVQVQDASPLEALYAICRAAQLDWSFPSETWGGPQPVEPEEPPDPHTPVHEGPAIFFTPNSYAERPRAFVRPYAVEIWEVVLKQSVDFRRPKSGGELSVGLFWPAGVRPYSAILEITSVTDDRGNQLLEGRDDTRYRPGPRGEYLGDGNPLRLYDRYRLRYPDPEARSLSSVRGTAKLFYLIKEKTVTFEAPGKSVGAQREIDGMTAELTEFKPLDTQIKTQVRISGRTLVEPPRLRARTVGGNAARSSRLTPVGDISDGLFQCSIDARLEVASIEVVVESECAEDFIDFEFKDVPLP